MCSYVSAVAYSSRNNVFNVPTGIWASLMLALLPLHVVNSHYLTSDVTMVFFLLLAVAGLLSTLESPRIRNQVWAGIAFGLAVATSAGRRVGSGDGWERCLSRS